MANILFLPSIYRSKDVSGQSSSDEKRDEIFLRIKNHPEQERKRIIRHPLLDEAAQNKAEDMAKRKYFGHTSPEGLTANENILLTGYEIPDYYPKKGNNGESISRGGGIPHKVVEGWFNSKPHRVHVFGHDGFYREQECVGVGWAEGTDFNYSVFISMPCYEEV